MNSIEEDTFIKPPHLSMEEYDEQVFGMQTKSYIYIYNNIKKE